MGAAMAAEKVMVFRDAQNMYKGARDAFVSRTDHHLTEQFSPQVLAEMLRGLGKPGFERALDGTRAYTVRPDATR